MIISENELSPHIECRAINRNAKPNSYGSIWNIWNIVILVLWCSDLDSKYDTLVHKNMPTRSNYILLLLFIDSGHFFIFTEREKNHFRKFLEQKMWLKLLPLLTPSPFRFCMNNGFGWNCLNSWTWITTIIWIEFIHSIFMIDMKYWISSISNIYIYSISPVRLDPNIEIRSNISFSMHANKQVPVITSQ